MIASLPEFLDFLLNWVRANFSGKQQVWPLFLAKRLKRVAGCVIFACHEGQTCLIPPKEAQRG